MGQTTSHDMPPHHGGHFYVGPLYATSLSYDRQTEVRIGGADENGAKDKKTVQIGARGSLNFLGAPSGRKVDIFKSLGIVVKTQGSRLMQNAEVMVVDYYRLDGRYFVARNRVQGTNPNDWRGIKGPAEASGGLRIGDTLYAINHRVVVNKSRRQVVRQIHNMLEKGDARPIIMTWKHTEEIHEISWDLEEALPPPEGQYVQLENEWGPALPNKISSVSI